MVLRYGIAVLFIWCLTGTALAEESSGDAPGTTASTEADSPGQEADATAPDTTATEPDTPTTEPDTPTTEQSSNTTDPEAADAAPESYDAAAVRCPPGCVPAASVPDASSAPDIRNCPGGCVAVEAVKWQRDMRRGTAGGVEKKSPELPPIGAQPNLPRVEEVVTEAVRVSVHDASNRRIVFGPTAMVGIDGQLSVDVHELQVLELQYSLNRNLQLGAILTMPVLGLGGFGSLRYNFAASDNIFLGVGAFGGGVTSVGSMMTNHPMYFAGAHAGVSFSTSGGTVFNMGAILSAVVMEQFNQDDLKVGFLPVPYIGMSIAISSKWSFVGEFFLPLTSVIDPDDPDSFDVGNPFLLFYGARFSTKRIYGNMGFFIPLNSYLIKFLMYCPPGFPYLSFGIRI